MTSRENKNTSTGGWPQHDFADSMTLWADVLNTLGMTKTSKNHVRKKVSRVVVVVERPLIDAFLDTCGASTLVSKNSIKK